VLGLWGVSIAWGDNPLRLDSGTQAAGFPVTLSDGKDYVWDIHNYGQIASGTNNAYGNGAYCQINGRNHHFGSGRMSGDGREVELGPVAVSSGVKLFRRVRVYRDVPLCRWIDTIVNESSGDFRFEMRIYSYMNYGVGQTVTSDGDATFDAKDTAFYTLPRHNVGTTPGVAQFVCGPRARVRPTLDVQGSQIYVKYQLNVPAGSTLAICYFHSQAYQEADLAKRMRQKLRYGRLIRDIPPAGRKLIVNWPAPNPLTTLDLDRDRWNDRIVLPGGDPLLGDIVNASFRIDALHGRVELPAQRVVGGVSSAPAGSGNVRMLLTDGQILAGRLLSEIGIQVPGAGAFSVPPSRLAQWSFRVDADRPMEQPFRGPYVVLDTGDRLAFDAGGTPLKLRTRYGELSLGSTGVLAVRLRREQHGLHQALLTHGGRIGGLLMGSRMRLHLRDADEPVDLPRHRIYQFEMASELLEEPAGACRLLLSNGDELLGSIATESFRLENAYGRIPIAGSEIQLLSSAGRPGFVDLRTWDGSYHGGKLDPSVVAFRLVSGRKLEIPVSYIAGLSYGPEAVPKHVVDRVARLVAQLGEGTDDQRAEAREALVKLGRPIRHLLVKHREQADDLDLQDSLDAIVEKLHDRENRGAGGFGPIPIMMGR
jgi:hypothetical protein